MTITRSLKDPEHPYTRVSNSFIYDRRLSLRSKALLLFVLSKPDTWVFNYQDVSRFSSDGIRSIRSSVRELIAFGYCVLRQGHRPNGDFNYSVYLFFEKPLKINTIKTTIPAHGSFAHTLQAHTLTAHTLSGFTLNNKIKKLLREETTTKPTNVVNTDVGVVSKISKEERIELLDLFLKLGIMSSKKMFDNFNNRDILKYTKWMYDEKIEADNPTGYLISACQRKFIINFIPEDKKKIPGNFVYQCKKCTGIFGYDTQFPNYEFCNKCAGRTS